MPTVWWRAKMGSRPLSAGCSSESTDADGVGRNDNAPIRTGRFRRLGATNTNAREHSQPDRLKLLFRDPRGYRTISEQKVAEWLSKNSQFSTTMPKDLTEIPEHIYSPIPDVDESQDEAVNTQLNKSERSGHNATQQCRDPDSHKVYQMKRRKDKMNHYMPKSGGPKQHLNNGSVVISESEMIQRKVTKSLGRMNRGDKRNDDSDVHRTDGSTTSAASISTRLTSKEREPLAEKRYHLTNCRRDSHSTAPCSSRHAAMYSEKWPPNMPILAARKTLPSMLQNNAILRHRLRQIDSCIEPGKPMQRTLSNKRSYSNRQKGICVIPKREEVYRKPEMRRMGKDRSTQDSRSQLTKVHKSLSYSSVWRSPSTMRRLRKIATMWIGGETRTP